MSISQKLSEEVQALERLDLQGLREAWRRGFGEPPALRSPELLRSILAWKLQAAMLGGLDAETRRRLRLASPPRAPHLDPGTRITREWKGVRHEVEVIDQGFAYRGQTFSSLSQIARKITGVRWNGPRFFGLRDGKDE